MSFLMSINEDEETDILFENHKIHGNFTKYWGQIKLYL